MWIFDFKVLCEGLKDTILVRNNYEALINLILSTKNLWRPLRLKHWMNAPQKCRIVGKMRFALSQSSRRSGPSYQKARNIAYLRKSLFPNTCKCDKDTILTGMSIIHSTFHIHLLLFNFIVQVHTPFDNIQNLFNFHVIFTSHTNIPLCVPFQFAFNHFSIINAAAT